MREDAECAFDLFLATYEPRHPKSAQCLEKDRDELMASYDFPVQHWQSKWMSNPIEPSFGTIRHPSRRTLYSGASAFWSATSTCGLIILHQLRGNGSGCVGKSSTMAEVPAWLAVLSLIWMGRKLVYAITTLRKNA